jgi:23S rRNA (uracil1939-C5)-methyltransferase
VITLDIEAFSSNGEGIARHEGIVHFVPRALPGERCEVEVVHSSKHWRRAHVRRLLAASPDRVEPPCPIYDACGGCQLQHMAYAKQLEFKRDAVRDVLRRVGHVEIEPEPTVPSEPLGYRRKISLSVHERDGALALGLHRWDDPAALVRIERCPLLTDELNAALPAVEAWINSGELAWCRSGLRRVVLRHGTSPHPDEPLVVVLACDPLPPRPRYPGKIPLPPGVAAAFCATRPEGAPIYQLGPSTTEPLFPAAFVQVNADVARRLYRAIVELAAADAYHDEAAGLVQVPAGVGATRSVVIDAYAGAGVLAEQLGHQGHNVVAIELDRDAVAAARRRIQAAGLRRRVIVRRGRVEDLLPGHLPADLVVLDPPRAGCDPRVIRALVARPPARIAYISCHPAAFARDARRLLDAAHILDRLTPFDMFPQTYHVELLAELRHEPASSGV